MANLIFANLLQASAQGQGGGATSMFIMLILMFAVMYFFFFRPQQKRQKEIQQFRSSLGKGSQVITAGGVYGKVHEVNEDGTIVLEIANGVKIKVDRNYVFADPNQAAQAPAK